MKVKQPFKAALALKGWTLLDFCSNVNASHTSVYRILNAMENDPEKIPNTQEADAIVGKINDIITETKLTSVND